MGIETKRQIIKDNFSEEERLDLLVEYFDFLVRSWAFMPDNEPFGRKLAIELGWKL